MSLLSEWLPALKQRSVESRRAKKFKRELYDFDADARETIVRVKDQTMMDPEKLYAFIVAVRYICKHEIPGDIVECGVWRGGAIMAAALTLNQLGSDDRRFYLYDTFTGMPRPGQRDRSLANKLDTLAYFEGRQTGDDSSDWCCASVDIVRHNLATIPYDQEKFVLIEGKVEDTLPRTLPGPIAILHLDTDWYEFDAASGRTPHALDGARRRSDRRRLLLLVGQSRCGRRVSGPSQDPGPADQGPAQCDRRRAAMRQVGHGGQTRPL